MFGEKRITIRVGADGKVDIDFPLTSDCDIKSAQTMELYGKIMKVNVDEAVRKESDVIGEEVTI